MADINEELRVLVTAEVDKAIKNLKSVDAQAKKTETSFEVLGKTISTAFIAKAVLDFAKDSVLAFEEDNKVLKVLDSTIQATGAAAWTSSKQLSQMAWNLQKITNFDDSKIMEMQSVLLGFKNIRGENFETATRAIMDMAQVMGMDLKSAAQSVGKALDDPIHGLDSLKKQGFAFTESQKQVIQSLLETGDVAAAQKIILDELSVTFGGASEAAASYFTQLKNSFDDFKSGAGKLINDSANEISGVLDEHPLVKFFSNPLAYILDKSSGGELDFYSLKGTFETLGQGMSTLVSDLKEINADSKDEDAFQKWFYHLEGFDAKIEASQKRIDYYREALEALEENPEDVSLRIDLLEELDLSSDEYERLQKGETTLNSLVKLRLSLWQETNQVMKDTQKEQSETLEKEQERKQAEANINDLMLEISKNYEKLGKDDPAVQLKNYEKQLDEIKNKREKLLTPVKDSDGNLIDTSEALTQLDYVEKKIREKIKALNDDGKKSWKQFWEDATGVSADSFKNGKQAGELYINGLKQSLENKKELANLLGNDFDFSAAIEDQMSEIEGVLTQLLSIPAEKITEVYTTADASVQKLIDYYRELNKQKKEFEVSDTIKALEEEYKRMTMTAEELARAESDAVIAKLENVKADELQIERVKELLELIRQAREERDKDKESMKNWEDALTDWIEGGIKELELFKTNVDASNQSLANLGTSLVSLAMNSSMTFLKELGTALGEGKNASESMQQALESMAQEVLNQLPLLFMQAGLQLIGQGQWPIGLGLMAAGLSTTFVSGYVDGKMKSAKANAFGGVYGDDSYSAFAKGGTFTNQIVAKPTYFRFAKGSGFGTGLMGEAGPEAIMPLTRGADGSLGVSASGIGGGDVQVNIPVTVYSDEPVEVHDTQDENGQRKIEILVGSMINQHIAGGKADRALRSRYGLKVQGV